MCIIIAKKAGVKRLDPQYFDKAWTSNPDGGGLVWKKPNEEVMCQKGFMNKEEFLSKIDELNQDDTAFIAHFRIKSVGAVCAENTHPFVFDHITYAHNGTLGIKPFDGKTDSETFGLCFLHDKTLDWCKEYKVLLEMALGHSKFAIMDNETGEILILNEDLGKERDGAWFSNESAFPVKILPVANYHHYYDDDYNSNLFNTYKPDTKFGTKNFKKDWATLSKDNYWIYDSTKQPCWACINNDIVIHKRGFDIIHPKFGVPAEAEDKKYQKGAKEIRLMEAMTRQLYKDVKAYHKSTFYAVWEREEAEAELSATYTVIRTMRMFIMAGKKIDDNEFLSFLLDHTELGSTNTKGRTRANAYSTYVNLCAQEVLVKLEEAVA